MFVHNETFDYQGKWLDWDSRNDEDGPLWRESKQVGVKSSLRIYDTSTWSLLDEIANTQAIHSSELLFSSQGEPIVAELALDPETQNVQVIEPYESRSRYNWHNADLKQNLVLLRQRAPGGYERIPVEDWFGEGRAQQFQSHTANRSIVSSLILRGDKQKSIIYQLWDLSDLDKPELTFELKGYTEPDSPTTAPAAALTRSGDLFAMVNHVRDEASHRPIHLVDLVSKQVRSLDPADPPLESTLKVKVAFAGDGSRLVVARNDRIMQVWDVESGEYLGKIGPQPGYPRSIVSAGPEIICSYPDSGEIRVWHVDRSLANEHPGWEFVPFAREGFKRRMRNTIPATELADQIHPRARKLFREGIIPWALPGDVQSGTETKEEIKQSESPGNVYEQRISPGGDYTMTVEFQWDDNKNSFMAHPRNARFMSLKEGGKTIAETPLLHQPFEGPPGKDNPTGMAEFIGPKHAMMDIRSGLQVLNLESGHQYRLGFPPEDRYLRPGYVWPIEASSSDVFLIDNTLIAMAELGVFPERRDNAVIFWNLEQGKEIKRIPTMGFSISPDRSLMIVHESEEVGLARIVDLATEKTISTLRGYGIMANLTHFSPDNKSLLAFSSDEGYRLWHVATGRKLIDIPEELLGGKGAFRFTNDGNGIYCNHVKNTPGGRWAQIIRLLTLPTLEEIDAKIEAKFTQEH